MIKYPEIDPVAFSLGPISVYWYGLSYLAAILLAWFILRVQRKALFSDQQIADIVFYGTIGILVGGRLGYALFYQLEYFLAHPISIFSIHQGGMSFHGGFLGVVATMYFLSIRWETSIFQLTDFIAPVVPIGLFLGRIGNFVNEELWGRVTDLPWGMQFPSVDLSSRHPSQLYEAFLEGIVLCVVLVWFSRSSPPIKSISGLFLLGYGVIRFLVEFTREPDAHLGFLLGGMFTMGQLLSLPMILLGIAIMWIGYHPRKT